MNPLNHPVQKALRRLFPILAISAAVSLAQAQSYTITDLTDVGGYYDTIVAAGINNTGTVVGDATHAAAPAIRAFSHSNGVLSDLGTLGGSQSHALAINDTGTIVGNAYTTGDVVYHAFSYSNGVMSDLGTLGGASAKPTASTAPVPLSAKLTRPAMAQAYYMHSAIVTG